MSFACCKRRSDSRWAATLKDWIGRRRFQQRVKGTTLEKSESRFGVEPSNCSVRLNQSAESSMLAVPADVGRRGCVGRAGPKSKGVGTGGREAGNSPQNPEPRG